ncbi:hypothetical protein RAE06_04840 [Corynebacterium tuberculostearicum]|uniref:hypothetical protein n=1 Tax=Corynebacterium tuberculostearicum TaxID=38304 RepID=UPI00293530B5|nr:hypothetical protein [Corynebacterium tuberculostearicum]MDV2428219.1 hypothetical protein [Corynebacterium tuberculostearicum]
MNRLPQTLTAAVLTGALAFGGAAVAQAQDGVPGELTLEGGQKVYQNHEGYYTYDKDRALQPDGEFNDLEKEESQKIEDLIKKDEEFRNAIDDPSDGWAPITTKQLAPEESATDDSEESEPTTTKQMLPEEEGEEEGSDLSTAGKVGIGIAVATGAGVLAHYFLNKDGKTWVKSQDRVNAEPTPEEKAESEKIVAEHEDEINAQLAEQGQGNNAEGTAPAAGESTADANRGISAETGSNSVAQALAALAVAAMVAAGAFVARRKFFA